MRRRDFVTRAGLAAGAGVSMLSAPASALSLRDPDRPAEDVALRLNAERAAYRATLDGLRRRRPGLRWLPDARFFLFGAGPRRTKLVYQAGVLREDGGQVVRRWEVAEEQVVPSAHAVRVKTTEGAEVVVAEDEEGVWIEEGGEREALTRAPVRLPDFAGHPLAAVLRVLHHEILVSFVDGGPVPNRFVYRKPWMRDGAMVGMVLADTGNLDLLRDWILGLRDPYDRNNAGEEEADNLGQALYLVSLVSDPRHPLVARVLSEVERFRKEGYIEGRSDFANRPVYQTAFLKLGLERLGLPDPYALPAVADAYGPLAWWASREGRVEVPRFDTSAAIRYPYLVWAEDHFHGSANGLLGNRDYPLTWEANASQADYEGMGPLDAAFTEERLCAPHTWHGAEMYLLLKGVEAAP